MFFFVFLVYEKWGEIIIYCGLLFFLGFVVVFVIIDVVVYSFSDKRAVHGMLNISENII